MGSGCGPTATARESNPLSGLWQVKERLRKTLAWPRPEGMLPSWVLGSVSSLWGEGEGRESGQEGQVAFTRGWSLPNVLSVLLCLLRWWWRLSHRDHPFLPQPPIPIFSGTSLSQPKGFTPLGGSQLLCWNIGPRLCRSTPPLPHPCFVVVVLGLSVEGARSTCGRKEEEGSPGPGRPDAVHVQRPRLCLLSPRADPGLAGRDGLPCSVSHRP